MNDDVELCVVHQRGEAPLISEGVIPPERRLTPDSRSQLFNIHGAE